ncbi:MAG: SDR family oxidoreductase [Balneolaceae bacterium]|nr:SDR family oxidoreductase [Balneolaceae bacterium]
MDLANKLCVVTGANAGIGKEVAQAFASRGAYLVMICRNEERGLKARDDIVRATGNSGVEVLLADFAWQYEIREVASHIAAKFEQVDVLVNNAGTVLSHREETLDGVEKTFAINHLAPFLLTNLLMERLLAAPDGRVVTVSSGAHRTGAGAFHLGNLQLDTSWSSYRAYGLSKLCNIMFTHELARRTRGTALSAFSMHPGVVNTRLTKEAGWLTRMAWNLGRPFMRSPEKGAETIVWLAEDDRVPERTGGYFKDRSEQEPHPLARDNELTEELWEISARLCSLGTEAQV